MKNKVIMGGATPARYDLVGEVALRFLEKTIFHAKRKVAGYHQNRKQKRAGKRKCPDCATTLSRYNDGEYCFCCTNRRFTEKPLKKTTKRDKNAD